MLLLSFLIFSVLVARKTTLHGGGFRSWSAEEGKENKIKKSGSILPPTPHVARSEKNKVKNHATHLQELRRSRSVSRPYKDSFGSSIKSRLLLRKTMYHYRFYFCMVNSTLAVRFLSG